MSWHHSRIVSTALLGDLGGKKKKRFFTAEHPLVFCTSPCTPGALLASKRDVGHRSCDFVLMIPNATLGFWGSDGGEKHHLSGMGKGQPPSPGTSATGGPVPGAARVQEALLLFGLLGV